MIEQGWVIPVTPEEVAWAEQANSSIQSGELPQSLADPYAVLDAPRVKLRFAEPIQSHPIDEQVTENLGRAARDGKAITQEVEEKMQADREAEERDADK